MSLHEKIFLIFLWCFLVIWSVDHFEACEVTLDYVKLNSNNPKYMKINEWKTFRTKNDRGRVRINSSMTTTWDIDFGTSLVHLDVFIFQAQQYRRFPFSVNFDPCWGLQTNYLGINRMLLHNSNLTKCPIVKGVYYFHDLLIIPEDIPTCPPQGQYMGQFSIQTEGEVILNITVVMKYL